MASEAGQQVTGNVIEAGNSLPNPEFPDIPPLQRGEGRKGVFRVGETVSDEVPAVIAADAFGIMNERAWTDSFDHAHTPPEQPEVQQPSTDPFGIEVEDTGLRTQERGGVFLGTIHSNPDGSVQYVEHRYFVTLPDQLHEQGEAGSTHVRFSPDAWAYILRVQDLVNEKYGANLGVSGWFHTHPDLTAFFSSADRNVQSNFHDGAAAVQGIVFDPIGDLSIISIHGKGPSANSDRTSHEIAKAAGETLFRHKGYYVVSSNNLESNGPSQVEVSELAAKVAEERGMPLPTIDIDAGAQDEVLVISAEEVAEETQTQDFEALLLLELSQAGIKGDIQSLQEIIQGYYQNPLLSEDLLDIPQQRLHEIAKNVLARSQNMMIEIQPSVLQRFASALKSVFVVESVEQSETLKQHLDTLLNSEQFKTYAEQLLQLYSGEENHLIASPTDALIAVEFLRALEKSKDAPDIVL
jgi:hypothetical protein